MMPDLTQTRAARFLQSLDSLGPEDRKDAFMNEAMETGGSYLPPHLRCSHLFEIALHDVNAWGADEEEAIRNWMKAARAQTPLIEDDGFITVHPPFPNPRNHAEEIANLRAETGQDTR